uniref:Uncharacterized protein n=1 Tax=Anguilla anguilla TaxID=7936 RepID=A0A0E9XYX6_ANGAN
MVREKLFYIVCLTFQISFYSGISFAKRLIYLINSGVTPGAFMVNTVFTEIKSPIC